MLAKIGDSFSSFRRGVRPMRLLLEDEGVIGCCWFSKRREDAGHIFANVLRFLICMTTSPIYLLLAGPLAQVVLKAFHLGWLFSAASTPDAVLASAPTGGTARYELIGYRPQWVLQVIIREGALVQYEQVPFTEDIRSLGYTAISYGMESAYTLFKEVGLALADVPTDQKRRFSLKDRKRIAERMLIEYASGRGRENPNTVDYVWLDEFCLSDASRGDHPNVQAERDVEVGRLADIFQGAARVAVFCDQIDCDHTSLTCFWSTRIFTMAEILQASQVIRMTRRRSEIGVQTVFHHESGPSFRRVIQHNAAAVGRLHLSSIMNHSVNPGSVPWQVAIHSLIVEVIRRDELGNFVDHEYLGKALNGLMPRRARLGDLGGRNGWADLVWLLELNQGFYNAATLAAVCSIAEDTTLGHCWLGRPIPPVEGSERLEALVTAFPVSISTEEGTVRAALNVIRSETMGLRHSLKRDGAGLYHNKVIQPLRFVAIIIWLIIALVACSQLSKNAKTAIAVLYFDCVLFCLFRLLVGTMYVVREDWVFLWDAQWGENPSRLLGKQDGHLRSLKHWGPRQMVPQWQAPGHDRRWARATLVDLKNGVFVSVIVTSRPNSLLTLAIHGSGLTCMLLDRPGNPLLTAEKVGMANLPPYALVQTIKAGTVCVY